MKIQILIFDGAEEIDFVGPYEVFRRAAICGYDIDTRLVTPEPQNEVVGQHGLKIIPQGILEDGKGIVFVPGGGWVARTVGVRQQIEGSLPKRLAAMWMQGTILAGICTGAMILSAAGILDGLPATTHQGAIEDLRKTKAEIVDARIVDAGQVITCGGVTSSIDLALWVLERFFGKQASEEIARYLEYPSIPGQKSLFYQADHKSSHRGR